MKASIKDLLQDFNGRVFVEVDAQDWEIVEGVDFQSLDEIVEYLVKSDLDFNDYAVILKGCER